jgi:tetraacyldisaccharide 4'-kinase
MAAHWKHALSRLWREKLRHAWLTRGGLARALWPLSRVYGALVKERWQEFASGQRPITRLPVPVVVVGNVVAGGAGKTPLVIALVRHCQQTGWHIGVVSRGHGRPSDAVELVTPNSTAESVGDEPLLIARSTQAPVCVGQDRVAAAKALLAQHPGLHLIVSDDGLQHLALGRDLELCVFDERGLGNGWLLPAGPLREPWPRQRAFAPMCMELQTNASVQDGRLVVPRQLADHAYRADGTQRPLWQWQGKSVRALAGIAKPETFFEGLQAQGLQLQQSMALPDHHDMQDAALQQALADASAGDVFCTEKDAVKLWPRFPHVWAVPLVVALPRALTDRVDALIVERQSPRYH